jgi:hypothetical protein
MSAVNSSENGIGKPTVNKNASLAQFPSNKIIIHTILLIGDSHIKDYADMTKDNLNNMFDVIGFLKSGADINTLSFRVEQKVEGKIILKD